MLYYTEVCNITYSLTQYKRSTLYIMLMTKV